MLKDEIEKKNQFKKEQKIIIWINLYQFAKFITRVMRS
jgi:hypothetical protein